MFGKIAHVHMSFYDGWASFHIPAMPITTNDVLLFLQILAFILLVILLFHLIFVAVDVRRIVRRAETVTRELEEVVLKPISIADTTIEWFAAFMEGLKSKKKADKKK